MATVATLLAAADTANDGTDAGLNTALTNYRAAAMKAAHDRDYDSAIQAAEAALMAISLMANSEQRGNGVGTKLEWRESEIRQAIAQMRTSQSADTGIQTVEVKYVTEDE